MGARFFYMKLEKCPYESRPFIKGASGKNIRRVGGDRIIPVDVRIIAATNRNLEEEVEKKQSRSDLYYRLNVLSLELPPLRKRLDDIPKSVNSFLIEFNDERKHKIKTVEKN